MAKLGSVITEYVVRNKSDEDIPVYSVTNEQGFCTGYFSKDVASKDRTTYKIVPRGYFAYNPSRINVGSVDWQDYEDRVIVSPLYVVFGVDEKLDKQYLLHYLKSDITRAYIKALAIGSVRDNLKFSALQEFSINLRPIEDQRHIAAVLDKVSELIFLRKQQLAKLDELVKSRFIELFREEDYSLTPLIDLIVEGAGLSYGIIVPGDNVEDGVPMIRPSDFKNNNLCLDNVYRVTPEIEAKYARTRLIGDEILVQVIGQPGQIMLSDSRCKGMNVTRNLAVVRSDCNKINRVYLKTYMQTQEAQAFMLGETKQSTLKQLPLSRLKELEIPMPPMELQEQFAAFVEQTDKSKLAIQQALDKLETLKKALMQEYFG